MATIKKNGIIVGKMGDLVYQEQRGKNIVKQNATDIKMTAETKKCSTEFAAANSASKGLRNGLQQYLNGMADTDMHGRFSGAIFKAIRRSFNPGEGRDRVGKRTFEDVDLSMLEGFDFNIKTPFQQYCSIRPEVAFVDGRVSIRVSGFDPMQDVKRVANSHMKALVFGVSVFNPKTQGMQSDIQEFRISGYHPGEEMAWESQPIADGKVVLVTVALIYYGSVGIDGIQILNNRELHPCTLLSAFRS